MEKQGPSPDETKLIGENDINEVLSWMEGKNALQIATEIALKRKQAIMGRTDVLTNVNNRNGLMESLEAIRAQVNRENYKKQDPKEILITLLDLDKFKERNDEGGHEEGDKLLQETANGLKKIVRETDVIARIGGDEFVLLSIIRNPSKYPNDFQVIENKIREKLKGIEVSIGHSLWRANEDFSVCLKRADGNMYMNKRERKSNV